MNQDELLDMVRRTQNLVDGSIISTDLNSLLIGFCDLINIQNKEIESLKEKMDRIEKSKEEMDIMKKSFEGKSMLMDQLQNQIGILASQTQAELIKSRQETDLIKVKFNEQQELSEEKIAELKNSFDNQIRLLAIQNNHTEEKLKKKAEEFTKQDEKLEFDLHDLKIQLNTFINEQNLSKFELPVVTEKETPQPIKEKVSDIDQSVIESINNQITLIEEKIEQNQNEINEVHYSSQNFKNDIKNSEKKIQKIIDNETTLLNSRIEALENQFQSVPEIQDLILSGEEVGLKQILQAIMRDSRRLDSFDQQVSSVRIECENVASGMVTLSEAVQQFNHQIFDFNREVKSNSNQITNEIELVKKFCKFLGKIVNNLVSDLARLTDGHHHLTSNITLSIDEISHLFTLISGRKLKTGPLLDEINLEASDLSTDMNQKKIDLNMEKQIQLLEGGNIEAINDEKLKKIDVPRYQKVNKPYKRSKSSYTYHGNTDDEIENANIQGYGINYLTASTLEELRTKINDIADVIVSTNNSVNSRFEDMYKELKKKIDSSNVDRIVSKIQNMLKKIQNEIDLLKSQKSTFTSSKGNQNIRRNDQPSINLNINRNGSTNTTEERDFVFSSMSELRLISSSTSCPLKSYQSNGMVRPNTAVINKKIKNNCNELNAQKKSKGKDINSNLAIIQKASSGKLASSVISNPKNY